jgi:hypothetical protein
MMFARDFTEAQVANQLKPLITRLAPMDAKKKAEIEELEKAVLDAKETGKGIEKAEKELSERIAKMYRGRVQHLHDVYRCPHIVNASLYFKACGQKPEGFEEETLPKLTTSQVNSLWKAHKEDLEILDEESQTPKYNKTRVGPNFTAKWSAIVKAEAERANGEPTPPKPKAMSAKDMNAEVTEGKWESVGFCKLTQHHAGNRSIDGLEILDKDYKALDLIKQGANDLYEMVISEASKIEAELVKADAETKAEAKAEDKS